jgi:opacity protein-like surface antigen
MHVRTISLAALLLSLPVAAAAAPARAPAGGGTEIGAFIGLEDGDGDTGFSLRLDGEFPYSALNPDVRLSFVGSVGWSRWDFDTGFGGADASLNILKFVPAARFSFGRSPTLRPYADAGIGLYYARQSVDIPGFGSDSSSDVSILMRFAGGLQFQLSPTMSLGAEIGLTPYFGDVDDTTFSLMFGAMFRM